MPTTEPPKPLAPQVGIAGVAKPSDLFHQFLTKQWEWLRDLGTDDLETDLAALDVRVTAAEADIAALDARITVLETPRGCLATLSADLTAINTLSASAYNIPFNSEDYDTAACHDNSTNNSRMTVPSGVSWVRLSAAVRVESITTNTYLYAIIMKNGALTAYPGKTEIAVEITATVEVLALTGPVIQVSPGDYFEIRLVNASDASVSIMEAGTWFAMEILG